MTHPSNVASLDDRLRALAARRLRVAVTLTATMIVIYFGFIALIAFGRPRLAPRIVPGLTVGILLGALVIVASWLLTYVYVRWANTHYDVELQQLQSAAVAARSSPGRGPGAP